MAVGTRLRRVLFFLHLWAGAVFGVWFAFVGLTGAVLAWMPQLLPREMAWRAGLDAPRAGGPVPLSQAISSLRAARPDLPPPFLANVFLPSGEFAHYAWFVPNPKNPDDFHAILVDPNSGRYRGEHSLSGFTVGWIVNAHTSLLKGAPGRIATAALSAFAFLTLVTGTWMWWPKTRGQLRQRLRVKWGAGAKRVVHDLHNVLGVYLLLPLGLVTLTAVYMGLNNTTKQGVEKAIDRATGTIAPKTLACAPGKSLGPDDLVAAARRMAEGEVGSVTLPAKPGMPFTARFQTSETGVLRSGMLAIDPATGHVLSRTTDGAGTLGHRVSALAGDLHFAQIGGIGTRLLYTAAGLMPTGLWVTGLMMWRRRKVAERLRIAPSRPNVAGNAIESIA